MSTKVGILGSGSVAQILANGFKKHGYEVMMGTRDSAKLSDFVSKNEGIKVGSFSEAAKWADLLVLAVKGNVSIEALKLAGPENLKGKTIIDPTNPIADKPPEKNVIQFYSSLARSLHEDLQDAFPDANFVKAFSMIGGAHMVNPDFGAQKPTMFICGNNQTAKDAVSAILVKFGFEPEDLGDAPSARAIEPLCILWCIPGFQGKGWNHALKLLRK